MAHRPSIRQFIDHFRDQIPTLEAVEPPAYRKILYATALDPLARAAFGKTGNRARIVRMIDELTEWKERELVSLPQLQLLLREKKRARYRLFREVNGQLRQWSTGSILRISISPTPDQLIPFADADEIKLIQKCRYAELFYTYRNNLIHEFREPGYCMELSSDKDHPYYHSMIRDSWQLCFPVAFFAFMYASALSGLETFLLHRNQDPYAQFEFGSLWRAQ
jgi:hypothetical protein